MIDTRHLTGVGRDELVKLISDLAAELHDDRTMLRKVSENLTATQRRCTELVQLDRLARFLEANPELQPVLVDLAWAIERARALHPEGASELALLEECGEVARAHRRETPERVREELLDVAVVAMRLYIGERVE